MTEPNNLIKMSTFKTCPVCGKDFKALHFHMKAHKDVLEKEPIVEQAMPVTVEAEPTIKIETVPTETINLELRSILDNLYWQIIEGKSRAILLKYADSMLPTNQALIEIAQQLIDGNEKAKVLSYVKNS
jgi:hypothetical protein